MHCQHFSVVFVLPESGKKTSITVIKSVKSIKVQHVKIVNCVIKSVNIWQPGKLNASVINHPGTKLHTFSRITFCTFKELREKKNQPNDLHLLREKAPPDRALSTISHQHRRLSTRATPAAFLSSDTDQRCSCRSAAVPLLSLLDRTDVFICENQQKKKVQAVCVEKQKSFPRSTVSLRIWINAPVWRGEGKKKASFQKGPNNSNKNPQSECADDGEHSDTKQSSLSERKHSDESKEGLFSSGCSFYVGDVTSFESQKKQKTLL